MDLSIALLLDCNRRWSHPELSTGHGKCVWTHWLHRLIKCSLLWKQKPATESNNTIKCRQPPKVHYSTLLGLGPRFLSLLYCCLYSFLFTVKLSQAYPPRFYQWIDYLKNESVSRSRNWCQIQSGFSACVMAVNILRELLCIWSDWKSLNGLSFLEDLYINFRKMELVEIS